MAGNIGADSEQAVQEYEQLRANQGGKENVSYLSQVSNRYNVLVIGVYGRNKAIVKVDSVQEE